MGVLGPSGEGTWVRGWRLNINRHSRLQARCDDLWKGPYNVNPYHDKWVPGNRLVVLFDLYPLSNTCALCYTGSMRLTLILVITAMFVFTGCSSDSQEARDRKAVERQQSQYAKSQPIPAFDWSMERHLVIELYKLRNKRVATHSVWRSDFGTLEGDCPSMGYGIPYDTSLTNPLMATSEDDDGDDRRSLTSIGQAEPNGVFASTNTAATWVMCTGKSGMLEPHYIESKVTVYPGPVEVDYSTGRVQRVGAATVSVSTNK